MQKDQNWWKRTETKIYDQYGLIAYLLSLVFIYSCVIRHFISIETLMFIVLLASNLSNVYYVWGCFMIMAGVKYFQENYANEE